MRRKMRKRNLGQFSIECRREIGNSVEAWRTMGAYQFQPPGVLYTDKERVHGKRFLPLIFKAKNAIH
jgi:hypothetical protein